MEAPHQVVVIREPGPFTRSLAALILRLGLGLLFLMSGVNKFRSMTEETLATEAEPAATVTNEETSTGEPSTDAEGKAQSQNDLSTADGVNEPSQQDPDQTDSVPDRPSYPQSIQMMFSNAFLLGDQPWLVKLYTTALPYVELSLGVFLIAGLLTPLATFLTNLTLLSLFFGWLVLGKTEMYSSMFVYLIAGSMLQYVAGVSQNLLSLDGLLFSWFAKPKSMGEYTEK